MSIDTTGRLRNGPNSPTFRRRRTPTKQMTPTSRVRFEPTEGAERLFTPAFNEFLAALHDRLNAAR